MTMLSSSRDDWERLVAAVLRREELWQLFHDHSRSPSISTLSSESSWQFSRQVSSASDISVSRQALDPRAKASASEVNHKKPGAAKKRGFAAGATTIFAAPLNMIATLYRRKVQHPNHDDPREVYGGRLRKFSLDELKVATDNFSYRNLVGIGILGQIYRGRLSDGSMVAVKRLIDSSDWPQSVKYIKHWFEMEVDVRSRGVHINILGLLGFCIAGTERLLVYPFMVNGDVASHLRGRPVSQPPLDWSTRMHIATGTARGLAYLHEQCDPKVIHRDVKAATILLDEDFDAVVSSFAMAKLIHQNDADVETEVLGTIGYIAPEYISSGRCSDKTDVFAYGMFLLELVTAQTASDVVWLADDADCTLLDWVNGIIKEKKWGELVDSDLQDNYVQEELEQLLRLTLLCISSFPRERPKMSEIVRMLESGDGLLEDLEQKLAS